MKKYFCLLLVFSVTCLQAQTVKELLSKKDKCTFSFTTHDTTIDTANIEYIRNAAYGFNCARPLNFIDKYISVTDPATGYEISDTTNYVDSTGSAWLKIWQGYNVNRSVGVYDSEKKEFVKITREEVKKNIALVDSMYYHTLGTGLPYIGKFTALIKCKSMYGYTFDYTFLGTNTDYEFVYKCLLVEQPVSGDLVANNYLFRYKKSEADKYRNLAMFLANEFDAHYSRP